MLVNNFSKLALALSLIGVFTVVGVAVSVLPTISHNSSAQGGTGGGSGGGTTIVLPADFPAAVPLPAGKLNYSSGASPKWIVRYLVDGSYTNTVTAVQTLYVSHGYKDISGPNAVPYLYDNGVYQVNAAGIASHDHSNASTDVALYVTKK